MKIIDISQEIEPGMMVYPGDPDFHSRLVISFKHGDMCEVSEISMGSHCGTHVDAPRHMIPGGKALDDISLENFIGPCRIINIHSSVINEKILAEQNIKKGERILFRTDPEYRHRDGRGINPVVLNVKAAQYLSDCGVRLIGIDAPTIENMEISDGEVHRTLLSSGIAILEGLCLGEADAQEYFLSALPLKLIGENGAPCRAVLVEKE